MTTIGMHYDVIPGKEKLFEDRFLAVLEIIKSLPGHVESHLYEDIQSAGSYLILSRWEKLENFQSFIHSEAFAKTVAWGKAEILRDRPRHKVYTDQ
ncbi:MAG TPA: antibiotic biosynthesis monooxygenase [Tepidisphaeraceae bacterium]|nr:antibiotic biosynthesis monooxygenase [Tepidisphaeraceae bacterium]